MRVLAAQSSRRAGEPVRFGAGLVVVYSPAADERHDLVEMLALAIRGRSGKDLITVDIHGKSHTLAGELLRRVAAATSGGVSVLRAAPATHGALVADVGHRISAFRDQLRQLEERQHQLIDSIVAGSPNAAAVESVRVALQELSAVDPSSVNAKRTAFRLRQVLSRIHERRLGNADDPEMVTLRADLASLHLEAVIALGTDRMTDEEMVGALEAHHGPAVAANPPWQRLLDSLRAAGVDTRGLEPLSAARRWLEACDQGGRERQAAYDELGALAAAIPVVRQRVIEIGTPARGADHDESLPAALGRLALVSPEHRGDDVVGTIPLIIDDAFARVEPGDLPAVLAQLAVMGTTLQVIYVTGEPAVVVAARTLGEYADVVELAAAVD
jgi:hypothetical protein